MLNLYSLHQAELVFLFITYFLLSALIYAYLAAFTNLFYTKRREVECSYLEKRIKNNEATIGQRVSFFWNSLFGSIVTVQCYLSATVLTGFHYFIVGKYLGL